MTLEFTNDVRQHDLRTEVAGLGHSGATIQGMGDKTFFIRTKELSEDQRDNLLGALEHTLSPDGMEVRSFELVAPLVARGTVVVALWAVLFAAVGIFFYVWWAFRNVPSPFRYGTAAIVALVHDTIIVLGIFSILGAVVGMEVNKMFLIGLLTVIGYSVNDTIVVFDRIRENVLSYPNRGISEVVNLSVSETIGRSLNTSLTLLFALLALALIGGATIREFLLVLLIGVIIGTYSSIAIASQMLVSWEQGDLKRLLRRIVPGGSSAS